MNQLIRYALNLTILALALGVGATLVSSPSHTTSDGIPVLHWKQAGAQPGTSNVSLFVWPSTEIVQGLQSIAVTGYQDSVGIVVMTTTMDSKLSEGVRKRLDKAHKESDRSPNWCAKLSRIITQEPGVKFAWFGKRQSKRPRLDWQALENKLKSIQSKVSLAQETLKSYEMETAVLTNQLEKQWSERLVRQSIEDTGTITVMRARTLQGLRLRLAKAKVTDSETRLEGLSDIENARLDYLSSLNTLLKDTSGGDMLNLLEENSVYQSPVLSPPALTKTTTP